MKRSVCWMVLVALALGACARREAPRAEEKRYMLRGKVLSVDRAAKIVTVAHEAIPGFMDAMTMGFRLKDESDYARLERGDRIEATLVVSGSDAWLETLFITRPPPGSEDTPEPPKPPAGAKPGDEVPDARLVNQDGRALRLAALRGKVVVLTFFFTRCPLPNFCPLMNMNLARIAEGFQADAALAARVQLLSVSFDTEFDTPRVLRENRRLYRPRDAKGDVAWEFVTGKAEEIRRLADFFGVLYEGKGADITHNLRTAVIGRDGRVVEVFNGNTWKPEEVLAVIRKL